MMKDLVGVGAGLMYYGLGRRGGRCEGCANGDAYHVISYARIARNGVVWEIVATEFGVDIRCYTMLIGVGGMTLI